MAELANRKTAKVETISLKIGNASYKVTPVPANEVARANARIQRKVQPFLQQIKKTQRMSAVNASLIVLNA
jgi:hypothetical protein